MKHDNYMYHTDVYKIKVTVNGFVAVSATSGGHIAKMTSEFDLEHGASY